MKKYIIDTNIIRTCAMDLTFKEKIIKYNYLFYSPISVVEIASHINYNEKDRFHEFKNYLDEILKLKVSELPDPDAHIKHVILFNGKAPYPTQYTDIVKSITKARDFDSLDKGYIARVNGVVSKIKVKTSYINDLRNKYETDFIKDVLNHIQGRNSVKVTFKGMTRANKIKLFKFLDSEEFSILLYITLCRRCGVFLLGDKSVANDNVAINKLQPFIKGYANYIKMSVSGLNPQKRKNLYNDLMFLLYLINDEVSLITKDGDQLNLLKDSGFEKRVIRL